MILAGEAGVIKDEVKRLEDIGVTDLCAFVFHADDTAFERTVDFLGSLKLNGSFSSAMTIGVKTLPAASCV